MCDFYSDTKLIVFGIELYKNTKYTFYVLIPASLAQLDVRPTGDQEVPGSTPAEVGNILS